MLFRVIRLMGAGAALCLAWAAPCAEVLTYPVGTASVDVTPSYPVRLSGYAARKTESEGVAQRIWVKAIAIGADADGPAVLVTVDNVGVPRQLREDLVATLGRERGIRPEKVAVCSTHTHSAPCLEGVLPNLFLEPLPADQQERIARYTAELKAAMAKAALAALDARRSGSLYRGLSRAGFAANRRTKDGPVDHDVPVLLVRDHDGPARAIVAGYACHCTTLTGEFNQVCGDWAGYAREQLEKDYPGTTALVTIGCGADANPQPRPGWELARQHGQALAAAVSQCITGALSRVSGPLRCSTREIQLAFDTLPTRAEWEKLATDPGYPGKHARRNLERLDRGETLPRHLDYLVQTWEFGDDLALVFLPGEVVVDYSLRLKKEMDRARVWISAYANDVPCYVPSERVLREGGYEGGGAMVYYDRPTRFAPGLEDQIVGTVGGLLSNRFTASK